MIPTGARHGTMARTATLVMLVAWGCAGAAPPPAEREASPGAERPYLLERVDDAAVVQLYADGFEQLSLRDKTLVWHLYEAALAGRDIFYDQRYAESLEMRDVLEEILTHPDGVDPDSLAEIHRYTKLFWINSGPFNNLTAQKFVLNLTREQLRAAVDGAVGGGASLPTRDGESVDALLARLEPSFLDPRHDPIVTNKSPEAGQDILEASASNLYVGVSADDLAGFDEQYGLNSRLVRQDDGTLVEEVYRIDGRYGESIAEVVHHLEAAVPFATEPMAAALAALIQWYRTGADADRKAYDIAWVADKDSTVDTINGFIEVYMDPRGVKGSWEALVFYVNEEKTQPIQALAAEAQWFEDRMPWDPTYRKAGVRGITANAIDVVIETGESGPITPIGINLPNAQSVREQYGSKSVSLSNVIEAYDRSTPPGFREEFSWTAEEAARGRRWSSLASELTTNMHEVIGHASGRVSESVQGNPQTLLKEYFSALEEGRADLVALYFIADPKLAELGLVPAEDQDEIVRAEYEGYTRNALVQLRRVRDGNRIEEDHMRNRQLIIRWLMDNTDAIEVRERDGNVFYVMTDAEAFREGCGRLLAEVQRIKAEGDYAAAKALFDAHGIYFDPEIRDQVVARVAQHDLASYTGFVQPRLEPVRDANGAIIDVAISYPQDLTTQMLEYSGRELPR